MIPELDVFTVQVLTALVVNACGTLFIAETLLRRDEGAGRVWALAFLAAMLTTLAYVVWAQSPDVWWAIAVGNAAFLVGTGCLWLGCRRFNGRPIGWASALVAAAAIVAATAVFIAGPTGGAWAGALPLFISLVAFAGVGAAECLRGELGGSRTAWVLSAVLAVESLFYLARTAVFVVAGPDSVIFRSAFGTVVTSVVAVVLTIVAVVVLSVLRASRATLRSHLRPSALDSGQGGILTDEAFLGALADLIDRARSRSELVGVIAVRIDDLEQISTAFGSESARAVAETWRAGVRRHAPSNSFVAEDGASGLLVGVLIESPREARREAGAIYRGLFDDFGALATGDDGRSDVGSVIPVVGVGVALSDTVGYDPEAMVTVARGAAKRAAMNVDISILVGDAE